MELPSVSRKLGVFLVLLLLVLLVTANLLLTVWIILALRLNSQGGHSQAVKLWCSLLSLRTETKQQYVYRLGLDHKKCLYIGVGLGSVETVTNGTRISGTALVMDNLVASTITASAQAASLELAADKEVSGGQVSYRCKTMLHNRYII